MVARRDSSEWLPGLSPVSGCQEGVQSMVTRRESSEWLPGESPVSGCKEGVQSMVARVLPLSYCSVQT